MQLLPKLHTSNRGTARYDPSVLDERDMLTGLLTQAAITAQLQVEMNGAAGSAKPIALACFRVGMRGGKDHSLGNLAAVYLLRQIAQRLQAFAPRPDLVGHLDEGEYLAVFPGADFESGLDLSLQAKETLQQPYDLEPLHVSLSVVFGIAAIPDCGAVDAGDFVKRTLAVVPNLPVL
jgi:GGDEF domain-containing protein